MNEFVSVDFLVEPNKLSGFRQVLYSLSISNFHYVSSGPRFLNSIEYIHISGKIKTESATFLKLQIPDLQMRISSIPEPLKNKYRS
jgi:hypothetical protein